jgi:HEPN domain-containing protein
MSKIYLKAEKNLIIAKGLRNSQNEDYFRDMICYHVQQSVEMSLKFLLELSDVKYTFTHNITELLVLFEENAVELPVFDELILLAPVITNWEASSRYKDNFKEVLRNVDAGLLLAEKLLDFIMIKISMQRFDLMNDLTDF